MKPIKIKYWGILWLSKRGYLLLNGIGWLASLGLCVVCVFAGVLPPFSTLWRQDPAWGLANYFWWLFLVCLACQLIDAGVAWLKFAKEEDAQRLREEESAWQEDEEAIEPAEPSAAIRERPS